MRWCRAHSRKIKKFKAYIGDFVSIKFPSKFFDAIFSSATLEHLLDPLRILKEFRRILKDNGIVLITSIHNYNSFYVKLKLENWKYHAPPYHLNYFTPRSLSKLIEESGLRMVKMRTYGFDYRDLIEGLQKISSTGWIFMSRYPYLNKDASSDVSEPSFISAKKFLADIYLRIPMNRYGGKIEVIITEKSRRVII